MKQLLFIDLETFSSTDLRKANVYSYSEDPTFEILMVAWAVNDEPVRVTTDPAEITRLAEEIASGTYGPDGVVAHNANFERIALSRQLRLPVDEYLDPELFVDTMALAAVNGYPRNLEQLAKALGAEDKDSAGTRLINLFCKPDRFGRRTTPEDKPEDWDRFKAYCVQDVATLRDIFYRLPGWPTDTERDIFLVDQVINDRGITTDREMTAAAVAAAADNYREDFAEMKALTGLDNPNSGAQLLGWLNDRKVNATNLQKSTVDALLAHPKLTDDRYPDVRRVLELRQSLALVAAKKYSTALEWVSADNQLRGSFNYHGAHTGRWAGRGVQLQNLPSASLVPKDAGEDEANAILEDATYRLKLGLGADAETLKALVRALFVGPFTVVDYSAIEARVIAWLAGEAWALEAFESGRDIYVETAERMSTADQKLTRKEGKIATLALGYQGGLGSLRAMGAEGEDEDLWFLVSQWREANSNITRLWAEMDAAFRAGDRAVGDHLYIARDGRDRYLRLPSGRHMAYRDLKTRRGVTRWGKEIMQVSFKDPKKPGLRTDTYGGRLTENATQAVARDILAEALLRLEAEGYAVAGHVHDEVLVYGTHDPAELGDLMSEPTAWSAGLPIAAEGFRTDRYRKD